MYSKKSGNVRSSKWSYIILLSLLGALNSGAWALDLKQVYEASVVNDAQVRASRASADAVRERIPQANAQLMPNVALSAGRNYNDLTSTTPNILGQETTRQTHYFSGSQTLTVRQPLYRPYQLALLRQAEAQVKSGRESLRNVDLNPLMGYILVTAALTVIFNLIADILYSVLDPRIRLS